MANWTDTGLRTFVEQRFAQLTVNPGLTKAAMRPGAGASFNKKWLADRCGVNQSQMANILSGKDMRKLRMIQPLMEDALGLARSTLDPFAQAGSTKQYDVFLSAALGAVGTEEVFKLQRDDMIKVRDALERDLGLKVFWPGERVDRFRETNLEPYLGAAESLNALTASKAYVYVHSRPVVRGSIALMELGFALGRGIPTTILMVEESVEPIKVRDFINAVNSVYDRVQDLLSPVTMMSFESIGDAIAAIQRNGAHMFRGLA